MTIGQTDRRTDGRQTVTLRFPLDAAIVIIWTSVFLHLPTPNPVFILKSSQNNLLQSDLSTRSALHSYMHLNDYVAILLTDLA